MRQALLCLSWLIATTAQAQVVQGVLVSSSDSQPVPYGTVKGPDGTNRFTDAAGRFSLGNVRDGTYHIRARMLGYSPLDTTITLGPTRSDLTLRIAPAAIRLSTVPVTAKRNPACVATGIPNAETNRQLAAIFDQLKANVERYDLVLDKYPFRYRREESAIIHTDQQGDSTVFVDTAEYDSRVRRPYRVGSIVYDDVSMSGQARKTMYLPTFGDLGDPAFDAAHCFTYVGRESKLIRIDFQPSDSILSPDVSGSVYLDTTRFVVRRAVFNLTHADRIQPPVLGLSVITNFEEVVPLVPIITSAYAEQPLGLAISHGIDAATGRYHPVLTRRRLERYQTLDHTFIANRIGDAIIAQAPAPGDSASPLPPTTIAIGCSLPPSFETIDVAIYGTVGGAHPGDPNNDRLTLGIRRQFRLPALLDMSVYGLDGDTKVAPTLTGQVAFTLNGNGRLKSVDVAATSLIPSVDTALVVAVRRADSLKAFVGVPAGRYTMSLSSVTPEPRALAIDIAHLSVQVVPLARKAAINFQTPAPPLPNGVGTFQFVVDEHGRAIPTTLVTVKTSSPEFATAVGQQLAQLRFDPAVAGNCPIKQVLVQPLP